MRRRKRLLTGLNPNPRKLCCYNDWDKDVKFGKKTLKRNFSCGNPKRIQRRSRKRIRRSQTSNMKSGRIYGVNLVGKELSGGDGSSDGPFLRWTRRRQSSSYFIPARREARTPFYDMDSQRHLAGLASNQVLVLKKRIFRLASLLFTSLFKFDQLFSLLSILLCSMQYSSICWLLSSEQCSPSLQAGQGIHEVHHCSRHKMTRSAHCFYRWLWGCQSHQ